MSGQNILLGFFQTSLYWQKDCLKNVSGPIKTYLLSSLAAAVQESSAAPKLWWSPEAGRDPTAWFMLQEPTLNFHWTEFFVVCENNDKGYLYWNLKHFCFDKFMREPKEVSKLSWFFAFLLAFSEADLPSFQLCRLPQRYKYSNCMYSHI